MHLTYKRLVTQSGELDRTASSAALGPFSHEYQDEDSLPMRLICVLTVSLFSLFLAKAVS